MVLLCGTNRGDQQTADIAAELFGMIVSLLVDSAGFEQELKPIAGFIGFFQCNFQLRNKVFPTLRILGFMDIRSNGGSGSSKLFCHVSTFGYVDMIYQIDDDDGEFQGKVEKFIVGHWDHTPLLHDTIGGQVNQ